MGSSAYGVPLRWPGEQSSASEPVSNWLALASLVYTWPLTPNLSACCCPLSSSPDALIHQTTQHVGAVRTLDVNPFQSNLLVSGAGESEIFIWDLNNLTTPMSPGNKIHPLEDISGVAWNRQVSDLLGQCHVTK